MHARLHVCEHKYVCKCKYVCKYVESCVGLFDFVYVYMLMCSRHLA